MRMVNLPKTVWWILWSTGIFLVMMFLMRIGFVLVFRPPQDQQFSFVQTFLLGLRYDLRIALIPGLLVWIVGLIPIFHPFKKKLGQAFTFWLYTFFALLLFIFYVLDFANYAYLHQRLNASILSYAADATISAKMIWQTYPVGWIMLSIVAGVWVTMRLMNWLYMNVLCTKEWISSKTVLVIVHTLSFLIIGVGIFGRVGQYPLRWSDAYALGNDYAASVALNPFQSFFSSLQFRNYKINTTAVKEHYKWMADYLQVDQPDAEHLNFQRKTVYNNASATPTNVVLIISESFSAYKSSAFGNPLNTTPFFDSLAKEGALFTKCFTPHYGTARGVWATITGVPDVQPIKTSSRNPAAVDQHTILNSFTKYAKLYFLGGSTSWANIRGVLTNNIHQLQLFEEGYYKSPKVDVWGISDKNLFLEANEVIKKQKQPFFAIIQTAANHRPYTIPEEDLKWFQLKYPSKDSLTKYGFTSVEEYNAFRYADFSLQQFFHAIKHEPYFKNTLFVIIGDHGIRGDASAILPAVYTDAGLTNMHVPLLFYQPNVIPAQVNNNVCSQVDVLPSIAAVCKQSFTNTTLGRNVFDTSLKQHYAFIWDIDMQKKSVVSDNYYYGYRPGNNDEVLIDMMSGKKINQPQLQKEYRKITDAFFETAQYLLLNNQKSKLK